MRKFFHKLGLTLLTASVLTSEALAVCPQGILTIFNGTSGNGRAPNGNWRSIRTHYIITASEMAVAPGLVGQQIGGIEWEFSTAPSIATTGTLRVYMENTSDATNLKSSTWSTAI
ncbi:MAG: hypothetical protein NZM08_01545, partial [Chitinophagales bacterium]|nr:hypothetical protein [Chitinophagales bacterium]